ELGVLAFKRAYPSHRRGAAASAFRSEISTRAPRAWHPVANVVPLFICRRSCCWVRAATPWQRSMLPSTCQGPTNAANTWTIEEWSEHGPADEKDEVIATYQHTHVHSWQTTWMRSMTWSFIRSRTS